MKINLKNIYRKTIFSLIIVAILVSIISAFTYTANAANSELDSKITAPAAILVDNYTGTVLYEKNIDKRMYPASITKILTAIITIENCNLNDKAKASYDAIMSIPSGYSIGAIKVGEELSIEDLLNVLLVHSANDAANVLAEHVGGSIESFASMMNTKSAEIGCTNSHFVNPSGKHDDNHYSSAKDIALIMQYCMKNATFRKIASLRSCTLPATSLSEERTFSTTVEILIPGTSNRYYYPYAIAGKTGYTTEAQNCLVSVSKKDNLELTAVILGAGKTETGLSAKFTETISLYDYGYANYEIKNICKKDDVIKNIEVDWASSETKSLDLLSEEDIPVLISKSEDASKIEPQITLNKEIVAPFMQGTKLGKVSYKVNGVEYTTNLIASHDVEKTPLIKIGIIAGAVLLLLIVIFLLVLILKRENKRHKKMKKNNSRRYY